MQHSGSATHRTVLRLRTALLAVSLTLSGLLVINAWSVVGGGVLGGMGVVAECAAG